METTQELLNKYNQEPEKKFEALISRKLPYSTALFRDVPRTKIKIGSPEWDKDKCWHCQEFPRIKAEIDVIVDCERCYLKHFEKMDGTFISQDAHLPALKKLLKDHKEGTFKPAKLAPSSLGQFIQE